MAVFRKTVSPIKTIEIIRDSSVWDFKMRLLEVLEGDIINESFTRNVWPFLGP